MFQRFLAVMLAVMLLVVPACAQESDSPLYLLVTRDEQGQDTPAGSAVLFLDQSTLLTTVKSVHSNGDMYAVGTGGAFRVSRAAKISEESELVMLTLAEPASATPLELGSSDYQLTLMGHDAAGAQVTSAVSYTSFMPYNNAYALIFTAEQAVLPGSVLLDSKGSLACMTLAAYGEGINRYVAMTYDNIYAELYGAASALPNGASWVTGFTVTPGQGKMTVDWSMCDLTCEQEDCVIGVFFTDNANPYFSYLEAKEDTGTELCVAPGRTYSVWVQHAHGEMEVTAQRNAAEAVTVTLPQAQPFSQYDYQDYEFYLGSAAASDASGLVNTRVEPMEAVTAQTLSDPERAIFMQVASTYTIAETSECDLLVVLTTPEGFAFDYLGGFIFDVTLQTSDVWNVDITQMIQDYLSFNATGSMASGTYTLSYYLGGDMANEMSFTLE